MNQHRPESLHEPKATRFTALWVSGLLGLAVAIAVILAWEMLDQRHRNYVSTIADTIAQINEILIREDLEFRLAALERLAHRWSVANGTPRLEWEADATSYLEDMAGFQAIKWADTTLIIRWVVPLEGNEATLNLNIGNIETANTALATARETGKTAITQPFNLAQGGKGIAIYSPVTAAGQFDGVIIGVLRLDLWLDAVLERGQVTQFDTRIFLGEQQISRYDTETLVNETKWSKRYRFEVLGLSWTAMVTPTGDFVSPNGERWALSLLLGSLLLSALISTTVYLVMMGRIRRNELQQSANQLTGLFQNIPGMAYRCVNERSWPMEFVSDHCQEVSGYPRSDLEGQRVLWGELICPEDRERAWEAVQKAINADHDFEIEYRLTTRSGEVRWMWDRGRQIDNDTVCLEGFVTDITDRKRDELALAEAHSFSSAVVDAAVEAVITIDEGGRINSFNGAASRMFGYTLDEVSGKKINMLMPEPYQTEHDQYIANYLVTNQAQIIGSGRDLSARHQDGAIFPIHLSVSEIETPIGRKFVGLIRDMTSQRQAEREHRKYREQLAHVGRLNMLGEMAAGIAHEINQPLTAISLFSQAGKRLHDADQGADLSGIFDKLSQHAQRAGDVIERVQSMARRETSRTDTIECSALLEDIAKLAESEARILDINIDIDVVSSLPAVSVDSVQIQQVALNLLRNGMEAMRSINCGNGDTIRVRARLLEEGDIEVAIIDSGGGVSKAVASKLFTPFSTTKDSGMGMGLSISEAIINAHGGQLAFLNNDTTGATFFFTLPTVE